MLIVCVRTVCARMESSIEYMFTLIAKWRLKNLFCRFQAVMGVFRQNIQNKQTNKHIDLLHLVYLLSNQSVVSWQEDNHPRNNKQNLAGQ